MTPGGRRIPARLPDRISICNGLASSKTTASSRRVACSHSARRQRRRRRGSGALHRVHEVDDQLRGDAGRGIAERDVAG